MSTAALVLAVARNGAELLAAGDVGRHWGRPSALEGYDVGGLAGHLARAVLTLHTYLDAEPSARRDATDSAGYYVAVLGDHHPVDSEFHADVRRRGAEAGAEGPEALQARLADAIDRLASRLPGTDLSRPVEALHGVTLPLEEYLKTRLVELVVHLDDLAVSVGRQGAEVPEAASAWWPACSGRWRPPGPGVCRPFAASHERSATQTPYAPSEAVGPL